MASFRRAAVALVAVALASASAGAQAQVVTNGTGNSTYPTVWDALQGLNLTGLANLTALTGLDTTLRDPNITGTLFAPTNAAVAAALARLTSMRLNVTTVAPLVLLYHFSPNVSINFTDNLILPTYLATQNLTDTTPFITVRALSNDSWYLGGLIPGAVLNVTTKVTAGLADVYVITSVLIPPSNLLFGAPLTMSSLLSGTPGFTILPDIIKSDPVLNELVSSPTVAVTVFAPPDVAFSAFFTQYGLTKDKVIGTPLAQRIALYHIVPTLPITTAAIPVGTTRLPTGLNTTTDVLTVSKTLDFSGNSVISISGVDNRVPASVVIQDIPAAMSVVQVVSSILIPSGTIP